MNDMRRIGGDGEFVAVRGGWSAVIWAAVGLMRDAAVMVIRGGGVEGHPVSHFYVWDLIGKRFEA